MPVKNKKATSHKIVNNTPVKKFVVEEKLETTNKDTSTLEDLPKEPTNLSNGSSEDTHAPEQHIYSSPNEKVNDESLLKSDAEKDTLPSSNLTSFSLLDSDKGKSEEKVIMQENIKEISQNESVIASTSGDAPLKSSQDEVNKWIENYDEKEVTEKKKGSGFFKIFLIILIILSFAAVIAGGVYYYQINIAGGKKADKKEVTVEKKEEQKSSPTPIQEPVKEESKVDYSKYTLQILNGSGIPGEAGKAKDLLKDHKFKSLSTGNASNYDFEKTIVALKKGVPDQIFTDLKDSLGTTYELESKSEALDNTSKYDIVVTVGTRK
jgi:flagellar basal body-associated protein FliL